MNTQNTLCLDCTRENNPNPRSRSGRSSYCTRHTYIRTKQSRSKFRLEEIIAAEKWDELGAKRPDGTPVFSILHLDEAEQRYYARYNQYFLDLIKSVPFERRKKIHDDAVDGEDGTLMRYVEEPLVLLRNAKSLELRCALTSGEVEEMRWLVRQRTLITLLAES